MRAQRVGLDEGWPGLQGFNGDDRAASTATTDLINILDTVAVPIVVVRRDFMIAYFNKAAADLLGLSPSDIGRAPGDISVLAGFPRLEQQCSQVINSRLDCRVDFRDGDKWFVVRISLYTKGDGQVNGTVLTFTDVSAFRASLDHAIYERECTKAIINAVGDPLVVLDADQRIQSGNRAFYKMFGLSREETQGLPLNDLGNGAFELPLLHEPKEMLAYSHVFHSVEVPHVVTPKGQRTLILDAHPLSFPGHSERRVLVTFQDITARKQAEAARDLRSEEELRRSEAFLAEGQRLSLTGGFCWNVATDEITWSEQLYRIFEFEPGTTVTMERINARVHPEDVPMMNETIKWARAGGADFQYSLRLMMPDGSVKYVNAIADGSRDAEGRLEYIGAVQDVTQRRMSEEALAKARSELTKVAEVTSLGVLTASIAHEVNQPLSGIITNASTCLRMLDVDPPNIDGARETARRTIRDGNRASDVISRLRALFSKKEFALEPQDLNEATREVIALSLSELQSNSVMVQSELADDLPPVNGDRVQLQQVVLNLLRNASDAMAGVDDRPRQLTIRTELDEESRVRLTVLDVGAGLQTQNAESLFAPFYTTKTDGMGIGLSVSRSIIESHRGRLWAEPNDGPGAKFSFSLPRSSAAATS
ncbi:MAG TPA: PAS domain S-box protein [Gemmatimonadaceae bacterium]|nr:PAS domain S-box protein [Gemmatimonadaceae bacterium]